MKTTRTWKLTKLWSQTLDEGQPKLELVLTWHALIGCLSILARQVAKSLPMTLQPIQKEHNLHLYFRWFWKRLWLSSKVPNDFFAHFLEVSKANPSTNFWEWSSFSLIIQGNLFKTSYYKRKVGMCFSTRLLWFDVFTNASILSSILNVKVKKLKNLYTETYNLVFETILVMTV